MVSPSKFTRFSRTEIEALFASAQRVQKSKYWDILRAPRTHEYARILLVVSKAVGTAPVRNLIKRRIKSLFYEKEWYKSPHDVIIIIKKSASDIPYQKLAPLLAPFFE